MSYFSQQTATASATTDKLKLITASASATATSDVSQEDANNIATVLSKQIAQDNANTYASIINISYKNETVPELLYYFKISDFTKNVVNTATEILDTSNVSKALSLFGRADLYDENDNIGGEISASVNASTNTENSYTNVINYVGLNNGIIVWWPAPATIANLGLNTIINGMFSSSIVISNVAVGKDPFFYGKTFNVNVYPKDGKIYVSFTPYNT
jgi:hypothetical protein